MELFTIILINAERYYPPLQEKGKIILNNLFKQETGKTFTTVLLNAENYYPTLQEKGKINLSKKSSYFLTKAVVVTHEWIECTKLHPPSTQLLCSLPSKPTDVSTYQGNPKQLEVQHS